jgi:hypothetical protein
MDFAPLQQQRALRRKQQFEMSPIIRVSAILASTQEHSMNAIDRVRAREERYALATLVRLANNCERAAATANAVTPIAQVLSTDDLRTIAEILHGLADELPKP